MFGNIKATLSNEWIINQSKSKEEIFSLFEDFDDVNLNYDPKLKSYHINCNLQTFDLIKNKFLKNYNIENDYGDNLQKASKNGKNIINVPEYNIIEKNFLFDSDVWDFILNKRGSDLESLKTKYNFIVFTNHSENGIDNITFIQKNKHDQVSEFALSNEAIGLEENVGYAALMQLCYETANENTIEIYEDPIQNFLLNLEEDIKERYPRVLLRRNYEVGGISIIGNQIDAKKAKLFYRISASINKFTDYVSKSLNPANCRNNNLDKDMGSNVMKTDFDLLKKDNRCSNLTNDDSEKNIDLIEKVDPKIYNYGKIKEYNITSNDKIMSDFIVPEKSTSKNTRNKDTQNPIPTMIDDHFLKQFDDFAISEPNKVIDIDNFKDEIKESEIKAEYINIVNFSSNSLNNPKIDDNEDPFNLEAENDILIEETKKKKVPTATLR